MRAAFDFDIKYVTMLFWKGLTPLRPTLSYINAQRFVKWHCG